MLINQKSIWSLLSISLIIAGLSSCNGSFSSIEESSSSLDSSSPSSSVSSSSAYSLSLSEGSSVAEASYEDSMTWSEANHVYIHYKRILNTPGDYADWTIWAWQKAPNDLGGVQVDWSIIDQSGVVASLDFSGGTLDNLGHLYNEGQNFNDITRIGFLIVLRSSMANAVGMWTSDGGTDMYVNDFSTHIRPNGSVHLFAVEGSVSDYTYEYTGAEATDPYANDTGAFQSTSNVNSSASGYAKAITSQDFYNNVGTGYQIFVKSFSDSDGDGEGDIKGITLKLDYLDNLGVKVLWLTPINNSETYHGYDVSDYYGINPSMGTVTDYAELIFEAHKRDIRVVMDLVVNHTSAQNAWFQKSINLKKGTDSSGNEIDYRSFYHWKYDPTLSLEAPWHRFGTTNYYYYAKFATSMPELNYDYQGTRDAMVDVANYWLAFGVDGFRVDAVKHIYMADEVTKANTDTIIADGIYSNNKTKNINFFKEFNYRVKSVYPNAFLVGENFDGWDQRIAQYYEGMDSQLDFQNYYHLVNMMHGIESGSPQAQSAVFSSKYNSVFKAFRTQAINSAFTSNHDVARVLNHVMATKISASETRAAQTVSIADYSTALNKARSQVATTLLQPGTSWIYYGDELGMTGNWVLNDTGTDFNKDRWYRQPMKWANAGTANDAHYSFEGYQVEWDDTNASTTVKGAVEQQLDSTSMFSMMKLINDYKNANSALINGTYSALSTGYSNILAYRLTSTQGTFYIYVNFGASTISGFNKGGSTVGIGWNGATATSLPGYSFVVTK